ncbi:MAG: molecular chaperone DnaJ, partial [Eggerthellaceae bacterium]|nr:molecular chaperone DnaJ [Eggerthellaceae bacterium]
ELNEAYDVLSDPQKRMQYDRFGTIPGAAGGGSPYGGGGYVDLEDLFGGMGGMSDIFSSFFGGMAGGARSVRKEGRDMSVGLRITLEEAARGVNKEIVYNRLTKCPDCNGSGMSAGGHEVTCPDCNGKGRTVTVQQTMFGAMQSVGTCRNCSGTGKIIDKPCPECEGQGRVPDRQRVTVPVPAGIRDGQQIRVPGYGEAGMQGANAGDLIVTIRIMNHDFFQRDGENLHCSAKVSMTQAALGTTIQIDGVTEGEVISVDIPEGCQNGQVVKVKGHGMPRYNSSSKGDLYVHVSVEIPKKLNKKQRDLVESLAKEFGEDVKAARTPLQKIKDAFK